jgi:hypothetical protein
MLEGDKRERNEGGITSSPSHSISQTANPKINILLWLHNETVVWGHAVA